MSVAAGAPGRATAPRLWIVVPAAGAGRRFGGAVPKQYLDLDGCCVLERTLLRMAALGPAGLLVPLASADARGPQVVEGLAARGIPVRALPGGGDRAASVAGGLRGAFALGADADDWVLVHDAARPCVRVDECRALLSALADTPVGGLLGAPVADTLKRASGDGGAGLPKVVRTESRDGLWRAFTPQVFRAGLLREALDAAARAGAAITDEASAVERLGHAPLLFPGSPDNVKITRPDDLALVRAILAGQGAGTDEAPARVGSGP